MDCNLEFINNFVLGNKSRIDLFWSTIFGNFGKETLYLTIYFLLPLQVFFIGFLVILERLKNHASLYFFGMEKISIALPNLLAILLNISLWISYFLISIALIVYYYKPLNQRMEESKWMNTVQLSSNFSPAETTVFSALRISDELNKYAKANIPSDLGLGGDLDWIEGKCFSLLTGKRATGSYGAPNIASNSFFSGLNNENDILQRLKLNDWYPPSDAQKDEVFTKLFKLRDYIFKIGFWKDYSIGAQTYKSLAQTFMFANIQNKEEFLKNLNCTLKLFEEYGASKAPLKGIPHYTVKFTPKVSKAILIVALLVIFSMAIFFLPNLIVALAKKRFNLGLELATVKEMVNIFLVLLGLLIPFPWKK
jgi:hypothetical protein